MNTRNFVAVVLMSGIAATGWAQDESVNPGINASYLREGMVVTEWVERLEGEGREVVVNRDEIVNHLGIKPGMVIADIGTGTGLFLPAFAGLVGASGKVYAVDIVKKFLNHIDAQKAARDWTTVETVLCTERSVELPADAVDLAFICNVYHHFEYPHPSPPSKPHCGPTAVWC